MMKRKSAVAGMFYSIDPALLRKQISEFMLSAKTNPSCIGVISPHAGYGYSGKTATKALSSLKPAKSFIILGPNHTGLGQKLSLMLSGSWSTPLGDLDIDEPLAAELLRRTDIVDDMSAHMAEHSIEVQLPILQHISRNLPAWKSTAGSNNFKFVPVCIMNTDYSDGFMEMCISTGEAIAETIKHQMKKGKQTGIVASSDFSHYVPPETIDKREKQIVKSILELNVPRFFDAMSGSEASVCGYGPVAILMAAAKRLGVKAKEIDSSNSGGARAVSYRAIGFE